MDTDQGAAILVCPLRSTLRHLYDPEELAASPLHQLLDLRGQQDGSSLREMLLEAIEGLRPASNLPAQCKAWRIYGALYHRYVDQFAQHEVAKTLGLSVRQLRRQEHEAMSALASELWDRYHPQASTDGKSAGPHSNPSVTGYHARTGVSREQELHWLHNTTPVEPVTVSEIVRSAVRTITPLSRALRVSVDYRLPEGLPRLSVPYTTARQVLVDILSAAVRTGSTEKVIITAESRRRQVTVTILAQGQRPETHPDDWTESVDMARQLSELCGGTLVVAQEQGIHSPFRAQLGLPAIEEATVLIVDDNADALQLLERYLEGTPYSCVGSTDPRQILTLAQQLRPRAIVLDVMMPGMDGWELLEHLREDPDTNSIPVLVCTILPEAQLALTLGAAEFLRKPVSRVQLLSALGRLTGQELPESAALPGSAPQSAA